MNIIRIMKACFFINFLSLISYQIEIECKNNVNLGYGDWIIETDGELDLMKQLLKPGDVVFDIGANVGDWSLYALNTEPNISLYSFEPLPSIFEELKERLEAFPQSKIFNFAFSNREGRRPFYFYDETHDFSALSSFYCREVLKADHAPPKIIEVQEQSLAEFCKGKINKIDFLKIDAEGAEAIILDGAKDLLVNGQIKALQFEYGGCYVDANTTLQEIYQLLRNNNFLIFRIKKNGLIYIPDWNPSLENYDLCNYFAVKKSYFLNRLKTSCITKKCLHKIRKQKPV